MFKTEVMSLLSGGILERGGGSGLHRMDHWYLKMLVCRWHTSLRKKNKKVSEPDSFLHNGPFILPCQ